MSENTKSKMTEKKEERKRLEQQIRFIIEADKVKSVFRQTYLADGSRKENDAEHCLLYTSSKNIREAEYGDGKRDKEKLKYRTDPADHPAQASVLPDRQDRRL